MQLAERTPSNLVGAEQQPRHKLYQSLHVVQNIVRDQEIVTYSCHTSTG